jgi:hypothetical protein
MCCCKTREAFSVIVKEAFKKYHGQACNALQVMHYSKKKKYHGKACNAILQNSRAF